MKYIIASAAPVLVLLLLAWPAHVPAGSDPVEENRKAEAIMAAEDFLLLIDTEQFGKSWDVASSLFREQVPKETWIRQISSVRPALGELVRREIISADYMTELPGAPDGEYVVIQYESSFAGKRDGVETITPMLDKDGNWRVSGYYIR